jgi:4a-hydroxytetrahydrobiopterin dehydratase
MSFIPLFQRCRRGQPNRQRGHLRCRAGLDAGAERALFGENLGARDPFAGEIESNFGEKVLGNYNTEHIIRPPDAMAEITSLAKKKCVPSEGGALSRLEESQINILRNQCPGWRMSATAEGMECIACDWKVKSFTAALDLMRRIGDIAEGEGHHPDMHLTGYNNLRAELTTHALGGLTLNDFIVAAKVNDLEIGDLLPKRKQKFWA